MHHLFHSSELDAVCESLMESQQPTSHLSSCGSQALRLTSVQYETFPPRGCEKEVGEGGKGTEDAGKLNMRKQDKYCTHNKTEIQQEETCRIIH